VTSLTVVEFLRALATGMGVVIGIPLLIVIIRAAMAIGAMMRALEDLETLVRDFVKAANTRLDDQEHKITVLWDGLQERRRLEGGRRADDR
jgi:hypothetical protein